jgi:hypothetical protein
MNASVMPKVRPAKEGPVRGEGWALMTPFAYFSLFPSPMEKINE